MSKSSLQIVQNAAQALSPQQEKFNSLMQRIGMQRDLLRDWEAAIALFHKRYMAEIEPLRLQGRALKEQLLRLFHLLSDQKLPRADRGHLARVICSYADDLLASEQDDVKIAELKAIFNYHSDREYDQEQVPVEREQDTLNRKSEQKFLQEDSDTEGFDEPDWAELAAQQARDRAAAKAAKKEAAKALKKQAAEKQVSQSVREIYRKLASSLHPDRETDAVERERKTELMQRVNQAYSAGQLLQLLELQLEVEQIDLEHIGALSDDRLTHYNLVLEGQLREVKREVALVAETFKAGFGISPSETLTPKKLASMLTTEVVGRKQELLVLSKQLSAFTQSPSLFNDWLNDSRHFYDGR